MITNTDVTEDNVYFIEPQMKIEVALDIIVECSSGKGYVYLPDRRKQTELAQLVQETNCDLTVIFFETSNGDISERVYGYCQEIARTFLPFIKEKPLRWAHFVALQDRLVSRVRVVEHLRHAISHLNDPNILWVAPAPDSQSYLWDLLIAAFPQRTRPIRGTPPVKKVAELALRALEGGVRTFVPAEISQAVDLQRNSERKIVCISSTIHDVGYRNTLIPFVRRTIDDYNVIIVNSGSSKNSFDSVFNDDWIVDAANQGRIVKLDGEITRLPRPQIEALEYLKRISRKPLLGESLFEDLHKLYGQAIQEIGTQETYKVYQECLLNWRAAKAIASVADAIVVCPGRPIRSNILVAAAKIAGKGSVEIQTGTIARTPRFVCPPSDHVLAMDSESANVYKYLGRETGLHIVGSIKLDSELAPYRTMHKDDARTELGLEAAAHIWMIGSQPVGVEKMKQIASIVFEAADRLGNTTILLKLHPNETKIYEDMYRTLSRSFPQVNLIIKKNSKSLQSIVASDVVFTYFSTIGIESFAVKKMTIVVNPDKQKLPVDLVAMGVAYGASDSEEIIKLVSGTVLTGAVDNVLTDGKTLDRCMTVVREATENDVNLDERFKFIRENRFLRRQWRRLPLSARQKMAPLSRVARQIGLA
ncbi:hypothetical protein [Fodinicurvata sp. EGI_FJ10296]|uniref:hypothetical protein n=1 Tax=Fodinicurvata sp. EGI_FJ10296 TaxID=3231908 RepID=UPI003456CA35